MFELNRPMLDWLTISLWNPVAYAKIAEWASDLPPLPNSIDRDNDKPDRWLQYEGAKFATRDGTVFCGSGVQGADAHYVLWASGGIAHELWLQARQWVEHGYARVTRIDLQLTIDYDKNAWSQELLAEILRRETGKVVSYVESASGPQGAKLATIYFGSRQSDRVVRLYEKMGMGNDVHLRFEAECKGARARAVAEALVKGVDVGSLLVAELERLPDGVDGFLAVLADRDAHPVEVVKPDPDTVKWYKRQVLPSLDRYLNQHENDAEDVAYMFWRVIHEHLPPDMPF